MKKNISIYAFLLLAIALWAGCKDYDLYPGARVSPFIAMYDVRNMYKGQDVTLSVENMFGSGKIAGVVISDHSGKNMPEGLLILQDRRRLNQLRGIAIELGADAASYVPGDSLEIDVVGKVLTKVNGGLRIKGVTKTDITKVASGISIPVNRVPSNLILANPAMYENTLVVIVKGGFDPLPAPTDVLAGDKVLNDGFGDLNLHTEAGATFANNNLAIMANYFGIVFAKPVTADSITAQFRIRTANDITVLSSTVEIAPILITGFMADAKGGDGNYEYTQLMATRDIDFSVTPYSLVVTNNANASTPTGYPSKGWGMGGMRTYKFNMTSGRAAKGTFFYVGGTGKMINGATSTSMASSNWIRSFNYTTTDGDGFGTKTGGLYANSGNASGVAVFTGTTVNADSRPVDVIFVGSTGSLFTAGPPMQGYKITNTDWYDVKNPITLEDQPYYRQGSNTLNLVYNTADLGYFYKLGGVYNPALGRWIKARTQNNQLLTKESLLTEIEGEGATILK